MHARWGIFLQKFDFIFHHKSGHQNVVTNALSKQCHLLIVIKNEIVSLDSLKDTYKHDSDFGDI